MPLKDFLEELQGLHPIKPNTAQLLNAVQNNWTIPDWVAEKVIKEWMISRGYSKKEDRTLWNETLDSLMMNLGEWLR